MKNPFVDREKPEPGARTLTASVVVLVRPAAVPWIVIE
jgi:hypothetical protein